jgi:hypothetical protein
MAKVKIKFSPDSQAFEELRREIEQDLKRNVRNNFGDLRPFIKDAVNAAVEGTRGEFIPSPSEVAQLGVGAGGQEDKSRTEGAYKQLRTDDPNSVTSISVRKQRPNARGDLVGTITVSVDTRRLLVSDLARVPTPDSEAIDEIPWLDWLINGAPTNSDFRFVRKIGRNSVSRTGDGIMVEGGFWRFPPARPGAFQILSEAIEDRVVGFVQEEIGDIL